jgi:hypothetical protein
MVPSTSRRPRLSPPLRFGEGEQNPIATREKRRTVFTVGLAFWLASASTGMVTAAEPTPEDLTFFENQVRPLLVKSCQKCHGATKQQGALRLDSREAVLQGGDGGPAAVPGKPAESLLIKAVRHEGELQMPPKAKLTPDQAAVLSRWVERGLPWPAGAGPVSIRSGGVTDKDREFWSFRPLVKPPTPSVRDAAWPATEIDRFLLARLEAKGLKPAPAADRGTLLRRVTVDLTGLPPTPEELDAFLVDESPDAYAKVVDRLLASPHYGERWGRHWLDVVRYADTAGETADYPAPLAYRYRNWVIDAFNADLPYDEFVRDQIAGDLLAAKGPRERYAELVTATGFLAVSRRFGFDSENYQHLTIQDTIDTTGQAFLGLTLGCARCHDHKFDPVTRGDYYGLYGIFDSTRYAFPGSEQKHQPYDLVALTPADELALLKAAYKTRLADLAAEIKKLEEEKKTAEEPALVDRVLAEKRKAHDALAARRPYEVAYAVQEGKPHNVRIHKRGEPADLGDEAPRRWLELFGGDRVPPDAGSGRLQLADWLTRRENPLTARVMVNRIWQHHFGVGLVATPNDFGNRGRAPTHPELLDYLAYRFQTEGWSVKALHRQILLSQVYQTSSAADAEAVRLDPENELLAHSRRQRLDAESLRDALLVLGGRLDRSPAGPHPFPPMTQWGFTQHAPFAAEYPTDHRSVYLMTQRLRRHSFLALFDGPDANATTPVRGQTTVPTQALYLMNDPFVHDMAAGFANRLLAAETDDGRRITLAFRMALGRPPTESETQAVLPFLAAYQARMTAEGVPANVAGPKAWAALARTLFARNEFLFVD